MTQTIHTTVESAIAESIHRDITALADVSCESDVSFESEDSSEERDWDGNIITTYWGTTGEGYEWSVMVKKEA
jgi:hypothetical protein